MHNRVNINSGLDHTNIWVGEHMQMVFTIYLKQETQMQTLFTIVQCNIVFTIVK